MGRRVVAASVLGSGEESVGSGQCGCGRIDRKMKDRKMERERVNYETHERDGVMGWVWEEGKWEK
jgi:hypothetical protein